MGLRPWACAVRITDVVLLTSTRSPRWATDGERRLFGNATYRCHEADWEFFMGSSPFDDSVAVSLMGGRASSELFRRSLTASKRGAETKDSPGMDGAAHPVTRPAARSRHSSGTSEPCSR